MGNIAASIRQRLLNLSRAQGRPFQDVLQFYVMERFLYRLSRSKHADRFVLKGALMLQVWESPQARPTMDIDMLGRTDNDIWLLSRQFSFDVEILVQAISATFERRHTVIPERPLFDPGFAADKQPQWRAFLRRLGDDVPAELEFATVLSVLENFVGYALESDSASALKMNWPPGGPWQQMERGQ